VSYIRAIGKKFGKRFFTHRTFYLVSFEKNRCKKLENIA
jgi:hypothetical protein